MFRKNPRRTNYSSIFLRKFRIWPCFQLFTWFEFDFSGPGTCNRTIRSPCAVPALTRWWLQFQDCFVRLMASSGEILCASKDECLHPRRRRRYRATTEGAIPSAVSSIVVAVAAVAVAAAVRSCSSTSSDCRTVSSEPRPRLWAVSFVKAECKWQQNRQYEDHSRWGTVPQNMKTREFATSNEGKLTKLTKSHREPLRVTQSHCWKKRRKKEKRPPRSTSRDGSKFFRVVTRKSCSDWDQKNAIKKNSKPRTLKVALRPSGVSVEIQAKKTSL